MLSLIRIKDTASHEYIFSEKLLCTAFPRNEYRDLHLQQYNTRNEEKFHLLVAIENNKPVGFISYWQFDAFCYIEHFATDPELRNKGYGKAIMQEVLKELSSVVLEVEMPDNELSKRRIGFYKRMGFELCKKSYAQPPYRKGDDRLPMMLMSCNCNMEKNFEKITQQIHHKVYGCR